VWLTALIHLLKLHEAYWPEYFLDDQGQPREPDLSDLYEVARDEDVLYRWIDDLRVDETLLREAGTDPPACGVDYWVKELVLLISPERMPPRHFLAESALEKTGEGALDAKVAESLKPLAGQMFGNSDIFLRAVSKLINDETLLQANLEQLLDLTALLPEGQRDKEYGYRQYTQAIVTALEPFARHGTPYPKIRSVGDGQQFALADLDRQDQKVTVLIAAREQDQEKASTVLSLSIKRLQQVLFNRIARSDKALKPVVLLLDETRRIRAFKANEYVTFAREAQTACVVVYQSIDQIGDTQAITELLENIGTQIYLGTVVGNTARSFIRMLPFRHRAVVSEQVMISAQGVRGQTMTQSRELAEYVSTAELYSVPAGRWPAVVYFNDLPRRKPIMVDLTDPSLSAPVKSSDPGA
jgi:hypothetical protein